MKIFLLALIVLLSGAIHLRSQDTDKDILFISKGWKDFGGNRATGTFTYNYDVNYYRLALIVDPGVYYIQGAVTTYFSPLEQNFNKIYFNLRNNMTVDSVKYHGNHILNYLFNTSTTLEINLPGIILQNTSDSITVYYKGAPINDGFGSFVSSNTSCNPPNNKVMWTLSEPYGAKNWWPCKETLNDKADSLDMLVTCPAPYKVGSNGLLVNITNNANNTITYTWKHRYAIPAYLVAFAVANYENYSDWVPVPNTSPIEVLNYIYPCNTAAVNQTPLIIPMFQYFIEKFGEYPYKNEKYGHAQCGFGGGMEHSTMSFMGGFSKLLLAHELAHQWFGNKITCGSWQDIWLNEGFATYLEGLTCEQGWGDQTWTAWKSSKIANVTSNNLGSTYVTDTVNIGSIFNGRLVYNKGALILHMLRWQLGDELFFQGLYNYINHPNLVYGFAKSNDFKSIMETTSNSDLSEFFNDWLYNQGFPYYNIVWSKDLLCNKVYINITQTHSAGLDNFFEMKIPIRFSNGISNQTVVFDQNSPTQTNFETQLVFAPTSATFDPDKWICAQATVNEIPFNSAQRNIVWTGSVNNDWFNPDNWDCGVPTAADKVTIPPSLPECIIYSGLTAHCRQLNLQTDASLNIERYATLEIHD
jgi:aminopeptidase N